MFRLLDVFQSFKTILCVCPCCGSILGLSDLHLTYKGKAPKTWLDKYNLKLGQIEKRKERFDEEEEELRGDARKKGRKKVERMIRKTLCAEFAERYNPYDIKAILHPVDLVVFDGLNDRERLKNIIFLSRKTHDAELNSIRRSIEIAIDREKYDWKIARVSLEGSVELEE